MFVYVADIGFYNYEDHIGNSEYDSLPSSYGDTSHCARGAKRIRACDKANLRLVLAVLRLIHASLHQPRLRHRAVVGMGLSGSTPKWDRPKWAWA